GKMGAVYALARAPTSGRRGRQSPHSRSVWPVHSYSIFPFGYLVRQECNLIKILRPRIEMSRHRCRIFGDNLLACASVGSIVVGRSDAGQRDVAGRGRQKMVMPVARREAAAPPPGPPGEPAAGAF